MLFTGQVQGVGFRYTTREFAHQLGLNGWVKNLPDGNVEVIAEGDKTNIEKLCSLLEEQFQGYIQEKYVSFSEEKCNFQNFMIVH